MKYTKEKCDGSTVKGTGYGAGNKVILAERTYSSSSRDHDSGGYGGDYDSSFSGDTGSLRWPNLSREKNRNYEI